MEMKEESGGLLPGIRILDLADEKGSFCSKLLADLGASVIKVERPQGDPSRGIGPFFKKSPQPEESLSFCYNNSNKRGITLNLEKEAGREIFLRLAKRTDVVIETFPPGTLKKLKLDFEIVREANERLILVSITGFGQQGPRSNYKSCDIVASAFGGQMYVSGFPSTPPLKPFGEQSYYAASLFAAIGILLALKRRQQSGRGEHIDVSLQEAVASTLEHVMIQYFYEKIVPKRQGSLHWNSASIILPCKDGHLLISLLQKWETLVEWMDSEAMAEDLKDERYREEEYRLKHLDHVIEVLRRWTLTHTTHELFELGQLMRFPWAPVYSPKEVLDNPQLKARGFFVNVDHPEMGTSLPYAGVPYQFSLPRPNPWKRAPLKGEDNRRVYQEELGLSEEELQELSARGAI